jgi:hypothetical protein
MRTHQVLDFGNLEEEYEKRNAEYIRAKFVEVKG